MIIERRGNILEEQEAQVLVNPVNCVGVMGAGLAKQFKQKFPSMFVFYKRLCDRGAMKPCTVIMCPILSRKPFVGFCDDRKNVALFPTKWNWSDKSSLSDVNYTLQSLVVQMDKLGLTSVAIPKVGCGLGGLDWDNDVYPLVQAHFQHLTGITAYVYV